MRNLFLGAPIWLLLAISSFTYIPEEEHPTLGIGTAAPDFHLRAVDGKMYSLASFARARVLVVIFTCNHCPTAQAYEDRIIQLTSDYAARQVAVVAIMPNDPKALRLDELDFSDIGDSFAEMKIRAREKQFNFPYLYDGATQKVAHAYGPVATPHAFVFDSTRKLRYVGRIDDMESPFKTPKNSDTRNAIESILNGKEIQVKTTKVFGCSIKWSEKRSSVKRAFETWAKEPVAIHIIDRDSVSAILKNNSQKLRLIYVWTGRSGPNLDNFPELVTINRMYRDRDFEFIGLNTDGPARGDTALRILQKKQASNLNYSFDGRQKIKRVASIDPAWAGKLPYALLVEPGGKIAYAQQGSIDPAKWKKTIVNHGLIGKYP
jgi:hypothetical protein